MHGCRQGKGGRGTLVVATLRLYDGFMMDSTRWTLSCFHAVPRNMRPSQRSMRCQEWLSISHSLPQCHPHDILAL